MSTLTNILALFKFAFVYATLPSYKDTSWKTLIHTTFYVQFKSVKTLSQVIFDKFHLQDIDVNNPQVII